MNVLGPLEVASPLYPPCPVCACRSHERLFHGQLVQDCDSGEVLTTDELELRVLS